MAVGSLGLEFSINQFPVQGDFDVRINIREDFNFLRYGSEFGLQNVGVSFLDSDPINVNNNLIISINFRKLFGFDFIRVLRLKKLFNLKSFEFKIIFKSNLPQLFNNI